MRALARPGRVVTFYSYKGGTGRSMALSNIAWILASAGKRVLMIDWDLEAPGLHRYFKPFLIDHELASSDGLMDLIDRYASEAIRPPPEGQSLAPDWWRPLSDISEHVLGIAFAGFPSGGAIDLLPAGRQCETYAVKVSAFNWQNFFDRLGGGGFLDAVRQRAQADYDYVLIDSRTGVSDTAGICTAQMPDTLVVCFTYNNQSIKGAAAVADSARKLQGVLAQERMRAQRQAQEKAQENSRLPLEFEGMAAGVISDSPMPLRIFPVPMRVDTGESDRLALRQAFAREAFAPLLQGGPVQDLASYWAAVEVPHRVFYSYEEVLAPFKDDARDPKTVLAAFVRLTREISGSEVTDYSLPIAPELRQSLLEAYAQTPQTAPSQQASAAAMRETEDEALTRHVEATLLALTDEEREQARSVLGRLVRIGHDDEGGGVFPIRVAMSEFDAADRPMVALLAQRSVLVVNTSVSRSASNSLGQSAPQQIVSATHQRMFELSPMLQKWLAEDREFLLWRQQLRAYRSDWERSGDRSTLLSGSTLYETRVWLKKREQDLNEQELSYIRESLAAEQVPQPAPVSAAPAWQQPWPQASPQPTTDPFSESPAPRTQTKLNPILVGAAQRPATLPRFWVPGLVAVLLAVGGVASWFKKAGTAPDVAVSTPPDSTASAVALTNAQMLARQLREADAFFEAGQLDAAQKAYREVLALAPDNGHALLQMGRLSDGNGDYAKSAEYYQRAIQLSPKEAQPRIERAASLVSQGRLPEALEDLNTAITNEPNNALAYFNRAALNENLRQRKNALADYNEAIRLNQNLVPAYLRRAALNEPTNAAAARADYRAVLTLPTDASSVQIAQQRLQALDDSTQMKLPKPKPLKASAGAAKNKVSIQYTDEADGPAAQALAKALADSFAAWQVPAPERVSLRTEGEVRYFFAEDRALAERVNEATTLQLAKTGQARTLKTSLRDAAAYPNAQRGAVEVWLPALSVIAPTRGLKPQRASAPASAPPNLR